jgi:hypothetical protein
MRRVHRGLIPLLLLAAAAAWAVQTLVPTGDVSTGNWTTTPLWSKLDDDTGDSSAIQSENNPAADTLRVSVTDPASTPGSGTNTLNVKCRKTTSGGRQIDVTIRAMESTTTLGNTTSTDLDWASYTTISTTFTSPSNWNNLEVEVQADTVGGGPGRAAVCTYVEAVVPDAAAGRDLMILTVN